MIASSTVISIDASGGKIPEAFVFGTLMCGWCRLGVIWVHLLMMR